MEIPFEPVGQRPPILHKKRRPASYKAGKYAGIFQILLESSLLLGVLGYSLGSVLDRLLLIIQVLGIDDHILDQIPREHLWYNILPHIG